MRSLHDRVLDEVGRSIVDGQLAPGAVLLSADIERTHGVSRSVAREVVRVLASLGLVASVRRVGIRVLPAEHWNVLDPLVIRWRLAGDNRAAQLRSITELRRAVEPMAAELAAEHGPESHGAEIMRLASSLREVGRSGELDAFLELDIRFHGLVLAASGNDMFQALSGPIAEVLRGRTEHGLMPDRPHEDALQLHIDVADAIQGHRPSAAFAAMDAIMRQTSAEIEALWSATQRPVGPIPRP